MQDNDYLTINEFAKTVGKSRQAIYNQLDKKLNKYCQVLDNRKYLHKDALSLYKLSSVDKKVVKSCQVVDNQVKNNNDRYIQHLEEENKRLNERIDRLDQELKEARQDIKQLANEAHTLLAMKEQNQFVGQTTNADETQTTQQPKKKQGFFARIFKG